MYCPKCGQSQVAEEIRFCSRCGFALGFVSELLANNGMLPTHLVPDNPLARELSPRSKGTRQGGMLMLAGATLVPIIGLVCAALDVGGEPVLFGVITFILGLARFLFAVIFQQSHPAVNAPQPFRPAPQPQQFNAPPQYAALPQHQPTPAPQSYFGGRRDTAELPGQPSVTENTTRLLDNQIDHTER
jgi:hypothetical protein